MNTSSTSPETRSDDSPATPENKAGLSSYWPLLVAVGLAALAVGGYLLIAFFPWIVPASSAASGTMGDFFGGILNPAFSLIMIFLLIRSLKLTSDALKVSNEALEFSSQELQNSTKELELTRKELHGSRAAQESLTQNAKLVADFQICQDLDREFKSSLREFVRFIESKKFRDPESEWFSILKNRSDSYSNLTSVSMGQMPYEDKFLCKFENSNHWLLSVSHFAEEGVSIKTMRISLRAHASSIHRCFEILRRFPDYEASATAICDQAQNTLGKLNDIPFDQKRSMPSKPTRSHQSAT